VLLGKEETVLEDMSDRRNAIERCYGMEMNVQKDENNRNVEQPFLVRDMIDHKQLENVEYFRYLDNMTTNARRILEIKCRIVMAEAAFKKRRL
jgi:hypothetical protein